MEDWAPFLRGSYCWIYLDSNNSLSALARGDSNTEVIAILVARFWQMVQTYDICPWFPRVRPKLNPADLPTRSKRLPYTPRRSVSFKNSTRLFTLCRSQPASIPPKVRKGEKNARKYRH